MYAITATISGTNTEGWEFSCGLPTFYLNANVQGIMNEAHAEKIARAILDPLALSRYTYHITAVQV